MTMVNPTPPRAVLKARDVNQTPAPSDIDKASAVKEKPDRLDMTEVLSGEENEFYHEQKVLSSEDIVESFTEVSSGDEEEEDTFNHNKERSVPPSEEDDSVESKERAKKLFRYVCLNRCGEDLAHLADEGIEEWSVNDFEYVRDLGTGGTASVFCAREKQSGYLVALKVQKAGQDGICEIDIHENLDHPSVVRMIDYFYSDIPFRQGESSSDSENLVDDDSSNDDDDKEDAHKYLYMILELCETSLFDAIRDCEEYCLAEEKVVSWFRNAIDALEYIHTEGIIHCDCKSLNFLVANNGQSLKLADFGMAVQNDEKQVVGGSPIYMAPEHLMAWKHLTDNFDHRTDIYSLGVVFYEALVGYLPYEVIQDDNDSIVAQLLENQDDDNFPNPVLDLRKLDDYNTDDDEPFYIPPPIFPEFVSEEAQDLITRMMEPVPDDRISLADAKEHAWFQKYQH
jgi:aurora kinase, other